MFRESWRPLLFISVLLLIIIIPFLLVGDWVEARFAAWSEHPPHPAMTALVIIGILSTDIFLPIPSSAVSTLGGFQLGTLTGTLTSWLGMTVSAVIGFWLASWLGRPFALWFSKDQDLARMKATSDRYGPVFLVLLRGVPVMAEASVLLVGIHRLPWNRFLPPVLLSNFAISFVYSAFGHYAGQHQLVSLAVGVAIVLPVVMAIAVRRWLP